VRRSYRSSTNNTLTINAHIFNWTQETDNMASAPETPGDSTHTPVVVHCSESIRKAAWKNKLLPE
jgi:hypothetical protein